MNAEEGGEKEEGRNYPFEYPGEFLLIGEKMANGGHGVVVNGVGAPGAGTLSREERRRRRRATQKYRTAHATR